MAPARGPGGTAPASMRRRAVGARFGAPSLRSRNATSKATTNSSSCRVFLFLFLLLLPLLLLLLHRLHGELEGHLKVEVAVGQALRSTSSTAARGRLPARHTSRAPSAAWAPAPTFTPCVFTSAAAAPRTGPASACCLAASAPRRRTSR